MKRSELEALKAELATRYAEQLEREQTHLTIDQRAHMCIGFEHGLGWFLRVVEAAGFTVDADEGEPPGPMIVCTACRLASHAQRWAFPGGPRCPRCGAARG